MSNPPQASRAALHSAGAVVVHESPFKALEVPVEQGHPSEEFIERWIQPFYLSCASHPAQLEVPLRQIFPRLDESLIRTLLTYYNWRPRIVGGFFATLGGFVELTDHVGRLLLRSDVCYAGVTYCFALARFNTPAAVQYLRTYLDYYLRRPDLWFDQSVAFQALQFLDEANQTDHASLLAPLWRDFVANKPNWDPAPTCRRFAERMKTIEGLSARLRGAG